MIRILLAVALLALVLAPLVSLHQLGATEAGIPFPVASTGPVGTPNIDALLASTRL